MTCTSKLRLSLSLAACLLAAACTPDQNVSPDENIKRTCQNSSQCAKGEVCWEGLCIIGQCVVREDCLEYALANGEKFGIWGGLSERERRRLRRQRAQSARRTISA